MAGPDRLFEEARRLLELQEARLDDVRTRAIALLGSSGVVAGLFGIHLSSGSDHLATARKIFMVGALVAFLGVAVFSVLIHWRIDGWDEGEKLDSWLLRAEQADPVMEHFTFNMAHAFVDARQRNERVANSRGRYFRWLCVLFAMEVALWTFATVL